VEPWPSEPEPGKGQTPTRPLHPGDPPPWVTTAEQLAEWQALPEFEGLGPDV
jgi:hypothetical protein